MNTTTNRPPAAAAPTRVGRTLEDENRRNLTTRARCRGPGVRTTRGVAEGVPENRDALIGLVGAVLAERTDTRCYIGLDR